MCSEVLWDLPTDFPGMCGVKPITFINIVSTGVEKRQDPHWQSPDNQGGDTRSPDMQGLDIQRVEIDMAQSPESPLRSRQTWSGQSVQIARGPGRHDLDRWGQMSWGQAGK